MTTIPFKRRLSRRGVRPRSWWWPLFSNKKGGRAQPAAVLRQLRRQAAKTPSMRSASPAMFRAPPPQDQDGDGGHSPLQPIISKRRLIQKKIQAPPSRCPNLQLFSTPPSSSTSPPPRSKQHPAWSAAPPGGGVPSSMAGQRQEAPSLQAYNRAAATAATNCGAPPPRSKQNPARSAVSRGGGVSSSRRGIPTWQTKDPKRGAMTKRQLPKRGNGQRGKR